MSESEAINYIPWNPFTSSGIWSSFIQFADESQWNFDRIMKYIEKHQVSDCALICYI